MAEVVERFATSPERIRILRGLIHYRTALSETIITDGFQWLDGSFMEDKETLKSVPPNDIDVVTFFAIPEGKTQVELSTAHPELFNHGQVKATYLVDSYTHQIGMPMERFDVRQISYWYSMWSHRKNGMWKGFVQVDLSKKDDQLALYLLEQIEREGAQQ